jgi:hypothetical protein
MTTGLVAGYLIKKLVHILNQITVLICMVLALVKGNECFAASHISGMFEAEPLN